jgi:lipoprotein-releasing system permease protein
MSRLSLNFLLSRRILKDKGDRFSRPIVYLSVGGVSLGLVIMMIAIGVTSGYKQEIRNKVIAMGSHIRITHYDQNYSFEQVPINQNSDCILQLKDNPDVVEVQNYATKVGIIKTDDQVEGVVLKGVDNTFSWDFFKKNIIQGEGFSTTDTTASNSIIVSKRMADKLRLKVGDKVHTYFVQDPPRQRSFKISGIYETGLPEYDNMFALVDLRHVRKLNDWNDSLVSGVEVLTRNYDKIDEIGDYIHHHIDYDMKAETIKQIYPEIFEWIALFDMNVAVLLIITTCVCLVTMMSIFFIIVLEQTQTIGILKSLGMKTKQVVGTFILVAGDILLKGMLIGDAIALLLGFLQQKFHFIRLNPDTYYVHYVPTHFDWVQVLLLNVGVFAVCMAVLLIPAWVVSRKITPVNAVQFE